MLLLLRGVEAMKKSLSVVSSRPTPTRADRQRPPGDDRKCTLGSGPDGAPVEIDVIKLATSRALIQANSGFGKSWLLRRLLEQSHGIVQQLIIDPDGDFITLRQKFDDYVVVAVDDGDIPADPLTARSLARHLLQFKLSAVMDLSDMPLPQRFEFVHEFLRGLMEAPKDAWHPVAVVIDEAHEFAPQQGSPPSKKLVVDLMTRGRKRAYGGILATQRLASLEKNAAAQATNRLIGRCSMEADRRRAAYELGLSKNEQRVLSELGVGEFCAQGLAISNDMVRVNVGGVETPHGTREGATQPVPPSPALAVVLPQLVEALRAREGSRHGDEANATAQTPDAPPHETSEKLRRRGRRAAARPEAATVQRSAKPRTDIERRPSAASEPARSSGPSSNESIRASIDEHSGDVEITIRIAYPRRGRSQHPLPAESR